MKDFIAIADFSKTQVKEILDEAVRLKQEWLEGGNHPILKGKVLAMIFQKPSLRTRVSFDMAMRHLGGDALYLSPAEIGLGQRESIADVARVLSGYVEAIMARVFEHSHILELARWAKVPVINGLSDYNHPCQAMADVLTIRENFSSLDDLYVTFIGDGNNVAVSLAHASLKLGMNFHLVHPIGYRMTDPAMTLAEKIAKENHKKFIYSQNVQEAVGNADVIYTDTWTSMGQEDEAKHRESIFRPYQVNSALLELAKPHAIVMHCLPAHRGQEITDDVADGPRSRIFPQAHNRLHAQKAIMTYLLHP